MEFQSKVKNIALNYNNVLMPELGFGTHKLQGQDCINSIKYAIESGYRLIDTASVYKNENEIHLAIQQLINNSKITREQLFITSKIGPKQITDCIKVFEEIRNNLKTNYLDCLLIHWPGKSKLDPKDISHQKYRLQCYNKMEQLVKEKKLRSIGVSNFRVNHLEHLLKECEIKPVLNQIELHPFYQDIETIEYCWDNKIVVQGYSSLCQNQEILVGNEIMKGIAKKYNKSVQQLALKWSLQKGYCVIPKSKTERFIQENYDLYGFEIDEFEIEKIDQLNCYHKLCWDPSVILY